MYLFVMEFFTQENIVIPIMNRYRDFAFCNYILNLPYDEALELYFKCVEDLEDEKFENRCWDMYLVEIEAGLDKSFDDYLKSKKATTSYLTREDKEAEEERIINKFKNIDKRVVK